MKFVRYNADQEDPDCGMCDHISGGFDCCGSCGPEHGWYGYQRTEWIEDDEKAVRS